MAGFVVLNERADKEEGGNVITVQFEDNKRISVVHPDKRVLAEWWVPEKGCVEPRLVGPRSPHSREVVEMLRENGYPTAGRILLPKSSRR